MSLTEANFIAPDGDLPKDLFGLEALEPRVTAALEYVSGVVATVTTDEAIADGIIVHGVLAKLYRQAAVYWAKRPSSAQLADQGGMTWSNPAQLYASLAELEEKAYASALAAVGTTVVVQHPSGSVPTVIRP